MAFSDRRPDDLPEEAAPGAPNETGERGPTEEPRPNQSPDPVREEPVPDEGESGGKEA